MSSAIAPTSIQNPEVYNLCLLLVATGLFIWFIRLCRTGLSLSELHIAISSNQVVTYDHFLLHNQQAAANINEGIRPSDVSLRSYLQQVMRSRCQSPPALVPCIVSLVHVNKDRTKLVRQDGRYGLNFVFDAACPCSVQLFFGVDASHFANRRSEAFSLGGAHGVAWQRRASGFLAHHGLDKQSDGIRIASLPSKTLPFKARLSAWLSRLSPPGWRSHSSRRLSSHPPTPQEDKISSRRSEDSNFAPFPPPPPHVSIELSSLSSNDPDIQPVAAPLPSVPSPSAVRRAPPQLPQLIEVEGPVQVTVVGPPASAGSSSSSAVFSDGTFKSCTHSTMFPSGLNQTFSLSPSDYLDHDFLHMLAFPEDKGDVISTSPSRSRQDLSSMAGEASLSSTPTPTIARSEDESDDDSTESGQSIIPLVVAIKSFSSPVSGSSGDANVEAATLELVEITFRASSGEFVPVVQKQYVVCSQGCLELQEIYGTDDSSSDCVVCLCDPKDVTILPCKHFAVCRGCFVQLDKCPVCRCDITAYIHNGTSPVFNRNANLEKVSSVVLSVQPNGAGL